MGLSIKTSKMLWGRSGNMCAFPDCKKILVVGGTETDDPSVIGEEAHIIAQNIEGPRGFHPMPIEQRNKYDNIILLCSIHHKIIDDQVNKYSIDLLHTYKNLHEKWVSDNLIIDSRKNKEDELYASYIEKFITLTDLNEWTNWTSWILGASEIFPKEQFDSLKMVPDYIISRIWPKRYEALEASFYNFKNIVSDLIEVYDVYPHVRKDGYKVERFYTNYYKNNFTNFEDYNQENEIKAIEKYTFHVNLLQDLVIELTRAINYICDQVRQYIFESFRLEEGVILIIIGDILGSQSFKVEYQGKERIDRPYPGLKDFMIQREFRDLHIGRGFEEDYF